MVKGTFPLLPVSDIINTLAGWGLSVSHEQLVRPTSDFVENVYCACLQQVTGISYDTLRDPVQDALSVSAVDEKVDLYTAALSSNILLYHLTRFAEAARVNDFSAGDVTSPEPERTHHILSGFINFIKFTEQCCNAFVSDLRNRSESILVERDRVAEKLSTIRQKIKAMEDKIAEDEPRCRALKEENVALRAKLYQTKEHQKTTVEAVEALKAEKNALIKRKEALNGEIASLSDAISRTRSRIVQSPERIKRTISVMGTTAAEDKRTVAMHDNKVRDLQAKINSLADIERDVRGCVEQLQTVEKKLGSSVPPKKKVSFPSTPAVRAIRLTPLQRVQKQLSNAHEKLERAQRHAEDKKQASQRTIDRLQREYDEMAVERRDNDKQVEELREEANQVEAKE
ncbi:Nuf2 family-domain-containing protein [Infundibulicybe gibba]|nr:Nuf2 family-domain-containing protein [Infundibulicybe gibba]